MFKDVRVLAKKTAKLDKLLKNGVNPKASITYSRLLRRAMSTYNKLEVAVGKAYPLATPLEVNKHLNDWMRWASMRLENRIGRITQLPIPRWERRLYERIA